MQKPKFQNSKQQKKKHNHKHQTNILSTIQDQKHARHLNKSFKALASLTSKLKANLQGESPNKRRTTTPETN